MLIFFKNNRQIISLVSSFSLFLITLIFTIVTANPTFSQNNQNSLLSQSITQSIKSLSAAEKAELSQGKVILQGEKGEYIARVVTTGNLERAWEVLTDYDNFEKFLPNIVDSTIIQENSDRLIFEQVNLVDLWLLTKQFTVRIAAVKTPLAKIDFEMLEGDLGSLQGRWEIEPLSEDRILITHRVNVTPKSPSEGAIFYGIYETSLEDTLSAIAVEIKKRSS